MPSMRRCLSRPLLVLTSAALLVACAAAPDDAGGEAPAGGADTTAESVSLANCGVEVTVPAPPERVVTMNQAATEVLLSLGLVEAMAGSAYLDDAVLPELADAYEQVPVLADEYPSRELLLETEPDLVYASYASAFDDEAAGPRDALDALGIASYLSPAACPDADDAEALTVDDVMGEILDVGALFGVTGRAEALVGEHRARIADARQVLDDVGDVRVVWWDGGDDTPMVGACCGAPAMILDTLGLDNVFADVDGGWADVSWEQVVEQDPDVIVLVDADWDPAADKRRMLADDDALSQLSAVENDRLATLPFSSTTPGVRNVAAVEELAAAVADLDLP